MKDLVTLKEEKPKIRFIYPDDSVSEDIEILSLIRGIKNSKCQRPISMDFTKIPKGYKVDEKLKKWIFQELIYVFDRKVHIGSIFEELNTKAISNKSNEKE